MYHILELSYPNYVSKFVPSLKTSSVTFEEIMRILLCYHEHRL